MDNQRFEALVTTYIKQFDEEQKTQRFSEKLRSLDKLIADELERRKITSCLVNDYTIFLAPVEVYGRRCGIVSWAKFKELHKLKAVDI